MRLCGLFFFVLDSTADFPEAPQRFRNVRVVPLYVRFGDESLKDYVEIDPPRFYERLTTEAELPTTSQPTPADFLALDALMRDVDDARVFGGLHWRQSLRHGAQIGRRVSAYVTRTYFVPIDDRR